MSIHKTEGIVLRRYNLRETSLIVHFYTLESGRITTVLKGVRQDPGKFASSVDLFTHNDIVFYKKRNTALHLVSQCDLKENFTPIRQDMIKVGVANMMLELLDAVMPLEDANSDIFNLALSCLSEVALSNNPDKILTIFKIKLLSLSGFKPHLDSCVSCGDKIIDQSKFSLSLGGLLCKRCLSKDFSSREIFRGTIATILYIERNNLRTNLNLGMNPVIKKELGLILNAFLNFHLQKYFKSEKVLNQFINA